MPTSLEDKQANLMAGIVAHLTKEVEDARPDPDDPKDLEGQILKFDEELRVVWGWASVVTENGELVYDTHGDAIEPHVMLKAATEFMEDARLAKAMHEGGQVGEVVHSLPITTEIAKALGIQTSREGWIIAMKIHSDEVWARVKSGEFGAFSIGGKALRAAAE